MVKSSSILNKQSQDYVDLAILEVLNDDPHVDAIDLAHVLAGELEEYKLIGLREVDSAVDAIQERIKDLKSLRGESL